MNKDLTRRIIFFWGWSCFKFRNLGLARGIALEFYTSVAKGLKPKVKNIWGLILTFVEVAGEKLAGRPFYRVKTWHLAIKKCLLCQLIPSTIPHINSETNPPQPIILSMLFASISYNFLGQASVLLLYQYAPTLSRVKGPDLFLQSGPFQNFHKFFQELTWSQ